MNGRRVLVLGLDGASFEIIEPMVRAGRLPNLARLISEGSSGFLESTVPPVTIPAWVSMMTGKNPGRLGLFDLLKRVGYGVEPNGYCYGGQSSLWRILNAYGIRTGVMNLPGTYPPEEVDGFMVTGMMTPSRRSPFSYPPTLAADLDSIVSQYEIDAPQWQYSEKGRFVKDLYKVTEKRGMAAEYLIGSIPCDFYMIVFTSGDRLQHVLWRRREVIEAYWEELDMIIGGILRRVGEDTTVLVVSDHGFVPLTRTFYVNEWLRGRGYLRIRRKLNERIVVKLGRRLERLYRFLGDKKLLHPVMVFLEKIIGLERIWRYTFSYLSNERLNERVDWARTKAFSSIHTPQFGHIYINMEGRMEHGCVAEEEREGLCRAIINELKGLADPGTGGRLKVEVHTSEEVYSGPYVGEAPDIIFTIDEGRCEVDAKVGDGTLFAPGSPMTGWTGTHTKNGVLIARGLGVRRGFRVEEARIIDIAPTILHMFGIPPPGDVDGRALVEIFTEDAEISEREALTVPSGSRELKTGLDDDEKALIEARLRRLGYIS
ncbi:MAG: alkaline phosphatase family protein [Candidatus Bathyarchaeota archaeon]|nr:alkaline phosphatase family protein [Candidatus Bathyarchaeota archaeon]